MPAPRRVTAGRQRADDRHIAHLSRILRHTVAIDGEEDRAAISTARRAAELIQLYWPDIYEEHIAGLAVTPATMLATVGLFLSKAHQGLLDLQEWWEMTVDTTDPLALFRRRCRQPVSTSALMEIYESRGNVWEPAPMVYGLEVGWLAEQEPDDRFILIALMWRLWSKNPLMMSYFGHISEDAHERLVKTPELVAMIAAIEPLPMLDFNVRREAFWQTLEIDLGMHPLHEVTLGEVLGYAIGQTYNEYAAYSCSDLNESYGGNYDISWDDRDHVQQVHARQEEAFAISEGFWEMSDLVVAYPPLITLLAEALHHVMADVTAEHPGPDLSAIRAEVRAVIKAGLEEENQDDERPGAEEAQAEGADHAPAHARAA